MKKGQYRPRNRMLALCIAAACSLQAQAQQLPVQERTFEIAAQPLGQALIAFSDQAGIQVVTSNNDLANLRSMQLSGDYAPEQALQHLLEGSGLRYRVVGSNTIALMGTAQEEPPGGDAVRGKALEAALPPGAVSEAPQAEPQDLATAPEAPQDQSKPGDATTLGTITVTAQ
ncbi:STN domain-containing protein, partial [Luteimonas aquatica]|uniref:STN domain-containing protein n=1 Tax=Luteimonas aquatica TaxID=450364 RepID=UPI001F55FAED